MSESFLTECTAVLVRTPVVLNTLLRDLPDLLTEADEGPDTWSPRIVIGHLISGEITDWMPRLEIIMEHGPSLPFTPFDMTAHFRESEGKTLTQLLDEFQSLRSANLEKLAGLNLQENQLALTGTHPALGVVTARQLLATWCAHDLGHLVQVSRAMAKRYKHEVGPWAAYMSLLKAA